MKALSIAAAMLAGAQAALAQDFGTKKDVASQSAPTGPVVQPWDMIQMVAAVLVVALLLKWALPKVVARLGKRLSTPIGGSIKIEETIPFGGGQLQVVEVRGRTLLLCVTSSGVTSLADLTEAPQSQPEPKAFFDFLDEAKGDAPPEPAVAHAVVEQPAPADEDPAMTMDDAMQLIAAAQARLHIQSGTDQEDRWRRLTGS